MGVMVLNQSAVEISQHCSGIRDLDLLHTLAVLFPIEQIQKLRQI